MMSKSLDTFNKGLNVFYQGVDIYRKQGVPENVELDLKTFNTSKRCADYLLSTQETMNIIANSIDHQKQEAAYEKFDKLLRLQDINEGEINDLKDATAIVKGHCSRIYFSYKADPLLHTAVENDRKLAIKVLLEEMNDQTDKALMCAIRSRRSDVVKTLFYKHTSPVIITTQSLFKSVRLAIKIEAINSLDILITAINALDDADKHLSDYFKDKKDTSKLFQLAIQNNCNETVRTLVDYHPDLNLEFDDERPLTTAIKSNNIEAFKLLITRGAHLKYIDKSGNTLLTLIIKQNKVAFFKALQETIADMTQQMGSAQPNSGEVISDAPTPTKQARFSDLSGVSTINTVGSFKERNSYGARLGAKGGYLTKMSEIVNMCDQSDCTPLQYAGDNTAFASILIEAGAYQQGTRNRNHSFSIVDRLLRKNNVTMAQTADVTNANQFYYSGFTLLSLAAYYCCSEIIGILI
nr:ankyrin repeat domain-containing protein [Endozoicomonas sp.]